MSLSVFDGASARLAHLEQAEAAQVEPELDAACAQVAPIRSPTAPRQALVVVQHTPAAARVVLFALQLAPGCARIAAAPIAIVRRLHRAHADGLVDERPCPGSAAVANRSGIGRTTRARKEARQHGTGWGDGSDGAAHELLPKVLIVVAYVALGAGEADETAEPVVRDATPEGSRQLVELGVGYGASAGAAERQRSDGRKGRGRDGLMLQTAKSEFDWKEGGAQDRLAQRQQAEAALHHMLAAGVQRDVARLARCANFLT